MVVHPPHTHTHQVGSDDSYHMLPLEVCSVFCSCKQNSRSCFNLCYQQSPSGTDFLVKWLQESLTDCPELSADKQLFIQTCICKTTTRFFPHFLPGSGERWDGRDQLYFWQSSCSTCVCFSAIQNTLFQHPADVQCVSEVLQYSPPSSSQSSCYFRRDCSFKGRLMTLDPLAVRSIRPSCPREVTPRWRLRSLYFTFLCVPHACATPCVNEKKQGREREECDAFRGPIGEC